ncbi:MAG: molybdopterin-synthase adenylyltransferase MoeB [Aestuariivita sp.]|nr:molybdopterin-synthase adenylyltransferase MoeB [Aestuariivita sp.]MCY4201480.1 molybdopterin-synthase adenylyltransferase MoeB [Aestuariivita sp.]MCY4287722.1 molybdopterin-synthase adenylyltransferase MoeB [Aestuariivita sp.]MCY4347012.1 molybdopterin-synthase adenylyltransferase MoeB [Aestuariivita sp.]
MILVLGLAVVLWSAGALLGAPRSLQLMMVATIYVAVIIIQVALPSGHALREATGGSVAHWLILGGLTVLVLFYRNGLQRLRKLAHKRTASSQFELSSPGVFSEVELERYARHIILREIGGGGQRKLKTSRVLVIGAGGLGSPALQYLAAAGVGHVGIIDDDVVTNSNLQRQVIHRDADIGVAKVFSAASAMVAQNPFIDVKAYKRRLTAEIARDLIADYDVVLDGSDNIETRYLANAAAVAANRPLVSGALSQWEGQLSVFFPKKGGPCYQCLFPNPPAPELTPSCAAAGIVGPLPGVIGSMMALEAIKIITEAGTEIRGKMLIYDALWGETRQISVPRQSDCAICGRVNQSDGES